MKTLLRLHFVKVIVNSTPSHAITSSTNFYFYLFYELVSKQHLIILRISFYFIFQVTEDFPSLFRFFTQDSLVSITISLCSITCQLLFRTNGFILSLYITFLFNNSFLNLFCQCEQYFQASIVFGPLFFPSSISEKLFKCFSLHFSSLQHRVQNIEKKNPLALLI